MSGGLLLTNSQCLLAAPHTNKTPTQYVQQHIKLKPSSHPATRDELEKLYRTTIPLEIQKDIEYCEWQKALDGLDDLLEHEKDLSPHACQMIDMTRLRCLVKLAEEGKHSYWEAIAAIRRHLYLYPHSPYLAWIFLNLGKAYRLTKYFPEALAYDKMVLQNFSSSPEAPKAMIEAARVLRAQKEYAKAISWLKRLIRQYPNTDSANLARIVLAEMALEENNIKLAKKFINQIGPDIKKVYQLHPKLLLLQGKIAASEGKYRLARKLWLHYLNLATTSNQQAHVWFLMAESLMKQKLYPQAKKYYVLVKQEYPDSPSALFSKFRLAQLQNIEQQILHSYVHNIPAWEPTPDTILIMQEIIKNYHNEKIAQDAELELIKYEVSHQPFHALKHASDFVLSYSKSKYIPKIKQLVRQASAKLGKQPLNNKLLNDIITFGKNFVVLHSSTPISDTIKTFTTKCWLKLINRFLDNKAFIKAFYQEMALLNNFPDTISSTNIKQLTNNTINSINNVFIKKRNYLALLNFNNKYQKLINRVDNKYSYLYQAIAWKKLQCLDAALREFYSAYKQHPSKILLKKLSEDWMLTAIDAKDLTTVKALTILFNTQKNNPIFILGKAQLLQHKKQWNLLLTSYLPIINRIKPQNIKSKLTKICALAAIQTKHFSKFNQLWNSLRKNLSEKTQKDILEKLAYAEIKTGQNNKAVINLKKALQIDPNSLLLKWQLAIALQKLGKSNQAMKLANDIARSNNTMWAQAGMALASNISFWNGPAGSLVSHNKK